MSIDMATVHKRLLALEYFVSKIYAAEAFDAGLTLEQFKRLAADQLHAADGQTFPSLDPVQSDLASAEWRDRMEYLLTLQTQILADMLEKKEPE